MGRMDTTIVVVCFLSCQRRLASRRDTTWILNQACVEHSRDVQNDKSICPQNTIVLILFLQVESFLRNQARAGEKNTVRRKAKIGS